MLPLLREQGAGTSSVQDRVIGAGLQALDRHENGAAAKRLFRMFAVTQEDFVHPMAVIELLWRSCCAPESESEEGSLCDSAEGAAVDAAAGGPLAAAWVVNRWNPPSRHRAAVPAEAAAGRRAAQAASPSGQRHGRNGRWPHERNRVWASGHRH